MWSDILKETQSAISLGVDSTPQVSHFLGQAFYFCMFIMKHHIVFNL